MTTQVKGESTLHEDDISEPVSNDVKTETPVQLTMTPSIAVPDSKTPTPQPLKKSKTSSSTPAVQPTNSVPELPDDLNAADVIGGSTVRRYINQNLTAELLNGIKNCVSAKPDRPLKWLGEWLIKRDDDILHATDDDTEMEEQ